MESCSIDILIGHCENLYWTLSSVFDYILWINTWFHAIVVKFVLQLDGHRVISEL